MQGWEQLVLCTFILSSMIWYIVGLFIRYDNAGQACVSLLLPSAGKVFDWFYGITLGMLALVCCCVCLLFIYARHLDS